MHLLNRYNLFIFDWDNTLVSASFLLNLTRYMKSRYWKRPSSIKIKTVPTSRELSGIRLEDLEIESRIFSVAYSAYLAVQKPKLKPQAVKVLSRLKSSGKKVAIFSDGRSYRILKEIHIFDLGRYIDFALGANTIAKYKPDPTGLLYIMHRFKEDKKKSLYIGDMAIDIVTARMAGIDSCAISDGLSSVLALKREQPNYLFADLEAFLRAL